MIKFIEIINESISNIKPADIIDIIKTNYSKYKNFGLRALPKSIPVNPDDKLKNSNQWTWSGEDSGVSLGGVSTIGIFKVREEDIKNYLKKISQYSNKESNIILVGGLLAKRGQDEGELIIKDGIALKIWK